LSRPIVAVFGSSQTTPGSTDWDDAIRAGTRLADAGFDVVTGGYGGTMEAVSQGAHEAGGHVIGVTAPSLFPGRSIANPYVGELIEAQSLANRIDIMLQRSRATLALPGSIGTAAELIISWNTNHILRRSGGALLPAAAIGPAWRTVGLALVEMVGATEADIHWADNVDEGVDWIVSVTTS
jgi:uncharacterized protein (TIGR00730 family)